MTKPLGFWIFFFLLFFVLFFICLSGVFFGLTIQNDLRQWESLEGERILRVVTEDLETLARLNPVLSARDIARRLELLIEEHHIGFLFSYEGNLVLWVDGGSVRRAPEILNPEFSNQFVRDVQERYMNEVPAMFLNGSRPKGDFSRSLFEGLLTSEILSGISLGDYGDFLLFLGTKGVGSVGIVRSILDSVFERWIGILGSLFSLLLGISVLVSFGLGRLLGRGAVQLDLLAKGSREVQFPTSSIEELNRMFTTGQELQRELILKEGAIEHWTRNVAHDFRTPLTAMRVSIEGLQDGVLSPSNEVFEALLDQVGYLESLTKDFLYLTKLGSKEYPLRLEEFDYFELLKPMIDSLKVSNPNRLELLVRQRGKIAADRRLVERALKNLVDNGLVHSTGPVKIEIDGPKVEISNSGSLAKELLPRIFEPLVRGENSIVCGHGLGLSIVRSVVEIHRGSVEFTNKAHPIVVVFDLSSSQVPKS